MELHASFAILILSSAVLTDALSRDAHPTAPELPKKRTPITVPQLVIAARCQAKCLSKYLPHGVTDEACVTNAGCFDCWMTCEQLSLAHQPNQHPESVCHTSQCTSGCETACSFMGGSPVAMESLDTDTWWFPLTPRVHVLDEEHLRVSWVPVYHEHDLPGVYPVYILLWAYSSRPSWELVSITTENQADVLGPYKQYRDLRFLLLVVTEEGLVAKALPDLPEGVIYRKLDLGRPTEVSLGVDMLLVDGEVQAEVTWSHMDVEGGSSGDTDGEEIEVLWGRKSCQAHHSLPQCDLNNAVFFTNDTISTKLVSFVLTALTYNSEYWVKLTLPSGELTDKVFLTPWCNKPSADLRVCHDSPEVFISQDSIDKHAYTTTQAVPIYMIVAVCVAVGLLLLILVLVLVKRQTQMKRFLVAKANILRGTAGSIRSSIRGSMRRSPARWSSPTKLHSTCIGGSSTKSTPSGLTDETSPSCRFSGLAQRFLTRGAPGSAESTKRNPYLDELPCPPVPPRYYFDNISPSIPRKPEPFPFTIAEVYVDIEDALANVSSLSNEEYAETVLDGGHNLGKATSLPCLDELERADDAQKFKLYHTLSDPIDIWLDD